MMRGLVLGAGVLLIGVGAGAVPSRFNYQARLTDGSGVALNGAHTVFFSLFQGGTDAVAGSGMLVYSENSSLDIVNGVANHAVGTGDAPSPGPLLPAMFRSAGDVYLQVAVDTVGNVILPRTRLDSAPYALVSADGDARQPVSGPAPIVISVPGSYYLTGDVAAIAGQDGIDITTSGVFLDLNGFTLAGVTTAKVGVSIGEVKGVEISNGTVTKWPLGGIVADVLGSQVRVLRVFALANGNSGISLGERSYVEQCEADDTLGTSTMDCAGIQSASNGVVKNCICNGNETPFGSGFNGYGISVASGSLVSDCQCGTNSGGKNANSFGAGIRAVGQSTKIENCSCYFNGGNPVGGNGAGIYCDSDDEISGNTCVGNGHVISGTVSGYGIYANAGCFIHDNVCAQNNGLGGGSSVGIRAQDNSRVENNHCLQQTKTTANNYGIQILQTGSSVIKNTTALNGNAGLRFENTSGANYYAENVTHETTASISLAAGGANVAGTSDRSNINF